MRDIGFLEYIRTDSKTIKIRVDNQGAIILAKNPYLYERSKHIDISYYYIRDLKKRKKIKIIYVLITKIVANGFTKLLERIIFEKFKSILGLVDNSAKY